MKANAMDSLALFYEACAQLEIDDYRDYDKAITAMNEAIRWCQLFNNLYICFLQVLE